MTKSLKYLLKNRQSIVGGFSIISSKPVYFEKQIAIVMLPFIAIHILAYLLIKQTGTIAYETLGLVCVALALVLMVYSLLANHFKDGKLGLIYASGLGLLSAATWVLTDSPVYTGVILVVGILLSLLVFVIKNRARENLSLNRFVFVLFTIYLIFYQFITLDPENISIYTRVILIIGYVFCIFASFKYRSTLTFPLVLALTIAGISIEFMPDEQYLVRIISFVFLALFLCASIIFDELHTEHSLARKFVNFLVLYTLIFATIALSLAMSDYGPESPRPLIWGSFFLLFIIMGMISPSKLLSPAAFVSLLTFFDLSVVIEIFFANINGEQNLSWLFVLLISVAIRVAYSRYFNNQFSFLFHQIWILLIWGCVFVFSEDYGIESNAYTAFVVLLYGITVFGFKLVEFRKEIPWWAGLVSPRIAVSFIRGQRFIQNWVLNTKIATPAIVMVKLLSSLLAFMKATSRSFEVRDISLAMASILFFLSIKNLEIYPLLGFEYNDTGKLMMSVFIAAISYSFWGNMLDVLMVKYFAIFASFSPIIYLVYSSDSSEGVLEVTLFTASICSLIAASISFLSRKLPLRTFSH